MSKIDDKKIKEDLLQGKELKFARLRKELSIQTVSKKIIEEDIKE